MLNCWAVASIFSGLRGSTTDGSRPAGASDGASSASGPAGEATRAARPPPMCRATTKPATGLTASAAAQDPEAKSAGQADTFASPAAAAHTAILRGVDGSLNNHRMNRYVEGGIGVSRWASTVWRTRRRKRTRARMLQGAPATRATLSLCLPARTDENVSPPTRERVLCETNR